MENKSKLNTVLLIIIIILLVVGLSYFFFNNSKKESKENNIIQQSDSVKTEKLTASPYSFEVPEDWTHTGPRDLMGNGCLWDSLSKGGDGLKMGGEIGIYPKSCFDLSKAIGKKEFTEKDGYYIVAYYDQKSGTTVQEEQETKLVYQKIIDTFLIR